MMNKNYEKLYLAALKLSSKMVNSEAYGADFTLVDEEWSDLTVAICLVEQENKHQCKIAWEKAE